MPNVPTALQACLAAMSRAGRACVIAMAKGMNVCVIAMAKGIQTRQMFHTNENEFRFYSDLLWDKKLAKLLPLTAPLVTARKWASIEVRGLIPRAINKA